MKMNILPHGEKIRLVESLRAIRVKVSWKPSKETAHFRKRQTMRHLGPDASAEDYNRIILDVVRNGNNVIYLYDFGSIQYYAVRGSFQDREWLVVFGEGGLMETAFPPEDMDEYLVHRGFVLLGHVEEVLTWTQGPGS